MTQILEPTIYPRVSHKYEVEATVDGRDSKWVGDLADCEVLFRLLVGSPSATCVIFSKITSFPHCSNRRFTISVWRAR
jgi:hypothetical protein